MKPKNEVKCLGCAGASLNEAIKRFSPKARPSHGTNFVAHWRKKNHPNREIDPCT